MIKKWEDLPENLRNENVKKYYYILENKKSSLFIKRVFDIVLATVLVIILFPIFIFMSILIKVDSRGPIIFRQVRVTQYGKLFRIFKFRTMLKNAEKMGSQITTKNDNRVTRVGSVLRRLRLDELPQLFNIIKGDMTFVGTRPEVVKYVERYTDEMKATLLLPAGVTSEASIHYKDEDKLLESAEDADITYINKVLPAKMNYNLKSIREFSFLRDIKIMIRTIAVVMGKVDSRQKKKEEDTFTNTDK
jgi:lipopolysaccharide/colanic/teichoic acid biosynthesis glycosyltransferase